MIITVDASVFVASLRPREPGYAQSRQLVSHLATRRHSIVCPAIVITETVAAIARTSRDVFATEEAGVMLSRLSRLRLVSIDVEVAEDAARLAAKFFLRGADSLYLSIAARHTATLVTLDKELLSRGPGVIPTMTPTEWLRSAVGR